MELNLAINFNKVFTAIVIASILTGGACAVGAYRDINRLKEDVKEIEQIRVNTKKTKSLLCLMALKLKTITIEDEQKFCINNTTN